MASKSEISKAVLITGSSGGIGFATLVACVANGWYVFAACRNRNKLENAIDEYCSECEQSRDTLKSNVTILDYDVTDSNGVKAAFKSIKSSKLDLCGLVNCAGIMLDRMLISTSESDLQEQLDIHVKSTFLHVLLASRLMIRSQHASIVNLTSVIGLDGASGQIAYATAKSAVIGLTKASAKELGAHQIRVNAVAPGFIDTQMTEHYSDQKREEIINGVVLNRAGKAEDVAQCIVNLLSPSSSYITGQVIRVDGLMKV